MTGRSILYRKRGLDPTFSSVLSDRLVERARHVSDTELLHKSKGEPVQRLVFTGTGRRRAWTAEQKAQIVAESYACGETFVWLATASAPACAVPGGEKRRNLCACCGRR